MDMAIVDYRHKNGRISFFSTMYIHELFVTLKGDEFNGDALSNAVVKLFSHSTSKIITKMQQKSGDCV